MAPVLRFFYLGVLLGLLLCPRVCLRLLRTRSLSTFCATPHPTRLLTQALGVALLGFALGFRCLGYAWEGSFCLCRFFCPLLFPLPLRCSAQDLGFGFIGLCFCPGVLCLVWGGDHALFCMVFLLLICCCVQFSVFLGSDDSRGQEEDTWIWSGSVAGLAGGSPGFSNPVRLVCFGPFFKPFFLRCFVWAFALPTILPAPS